MLHAARVVVDDELQMRQPLLQRQDLVDLLLVLGHHHRDLGVIEQIGHLGGDRVLVHRHRDAAEALRGELRPVEPRPVVADHRELAAAAEAVRRKARGEVAHLAGIIGPAEGLPDAERLLAHRRPGGHRLGISAQQPRQCRAGRHAAASAGSWAPPK